MTEPGAAGCELWKREQDRLCSKGIRTPQDSANDRRLAALIVQEDIVTVSGTRRQHPDTDGPWPPILIARRRQWLATLGKGAAVRDRFALRDKTAIARLRPSDVTNRPALELELDDFIRRVNAMSVMLKGVPPPVPVEVEPRPGKGPRAFYGGALLLAPGVAEPPDDDAWGHGPGSLKDVLQGSRP